MSLEVRVSGLLDEVVVTALPRAFVAKVFAHCMGKSNTPYFANNCFKGVLYFNSDLAAKFAQGTGFAWKGWNAENAFYRQIGYVLEANLEVTAVVGGVERTLDPGSLIRQTNRVALEPVLARTSANEVVLLLGSVDKGSQTWVLPDFDGPFSEDSLALTLDSFEELLFEDRLVTGFSYSGRELQRGEGQSRGMNMITPVILSRQGGELDLYDFVG